jgi:hypothetical protein
MVESTDIGGTALRPEDLLSDELVGMMNDLHHTVTTIDENDPLYQQHIAFRQEIENRPIILALDDIKFEDSKDNISAIENVSFADTDKLEFENVDGIDSSWFLVDFRQHPANYAMPLAFFPVFGKTEKDSLMKCRNLAGETETFIVMGQRFIPEAISKAFKGKPYEVVA